MTAIDLARSTGSRLHVVAVGPTFPPRPSTKSTPKRRPRISGARPRRCWTSR
ncbi:MAG TPA: hypothetical protein VKA73_14505 [Rubrobacter sp.]|nr:hypothetical protein [Rubrobacter sp.]